MNSRASSCGFRRRAGRFRQPDCLTCGYTIRLAPGTDRYSVTTRKALRNDPEVHYNCAQAVVCAFAQDCGITEEQAKAVGANFGSGMKMAATCGAVTGGLMVLGLMGVEDGPSVAGFQRAIRDNHSGCLNCADLLRMNKEKGGEKKPHCDAMVYESVELVEKIIERVKAR